MKSSKIAIKFFLVNIGSHDNNESKIKLTEREKGEICIYYLTVTKENSSAELSPDGFHNCLAV